MLKRGGGLFEIKFDDLDIDDVRISKGTMIYNLSIRQLEIYV